MDYKKLYTYLVGEVDEAITMLETGDLLLVSKVRELLKAALLRAEDIYLENGEEEA